MCEVTGRWDISIWVRHREQALAASLEDVVTYRLPAKLVPRAFLPLLAGALTSVSADRAVLGRDEDALGSLAEAVGCLQQLERSEPGRWTLHLVKALTRQAVIVFRLGRHRDAQEVTATGLALARELPADAEGLSLLAAMLHLHGLTLRGSGRFAEALAAVEESLDVIGELADAEDMSPTARLASLRGSRAIVLGDLGRHREAAEEYGAAAELWRELPRALGAGHPGQRSEFLCNYAAALHRVGRHDDALVAIEEATSIARELVAMDPEGHAPSLANALGNRSVALFELGRYEDALAAADEALGLLRPLAERIPSVFLDRLANGLNNRSRALRGLGQHEAALAALEESLSVREMALAGAGDGGEGAAWRAGLALTRHNHALMLASVGRYEDALRAVDAALELLRELSRESQVHVPLLASALLNRAGRCGDLGLREEALAAIEEAMTLYECCALQAGSGQPV